MRWTDMKHLCKHPTEQVADLDYGSGLSRLSADR
jgi:hypothetical protein